LFVVRCREVIKGGLALSRQIVILPYSLDLHRPKSRRLAANIMSPTLVVLDSLIADSLAVIEGLSQYDVLALRHQLKRLNLLTYGLKRNLLARLLIYKHGCQKN
jgi:hypothetical protein